MTDPKPTIEILHMRDPDSECDVIVFVNGERVQVADYVDLDPGRGWTRADWDVRIEEAADDDTPFGKLVHAQLVEFQGNKYIQD